ncbi:helix-turn-helix domain-containing protein [Tenacibaculum sp.]|uniref:helix-turn-helix domain-containing protein n=1 Tax=Tenacibaculum sp. TaxID=1906242 RepID=UPI003D0A1003
MRKEEVKAIIDKLSGLDISSSCREQSYVRARWVYCKVCRMLFKKMSLREIGSLVGVDHSTVLYALKNVNNIIVNDNDTRNIYQKTLKIIEVREDLEQVDFDNILSLYDLQQAYDKKIENLTSYYEGKIDELNKSLGSFKPFLDSLSILDNKDFEEFKKTRLEPYLRMKKTLINK